MSDSNDALSISTHRTCDCYKKLQTYGIPLYISDENDIYAESPKKITFERAFELPGIIRINENIKEYLFVEDNELSNVFHHMAEIIPILSDFDENLLSFWILDMFIEGLWTAQNAKMTFDHQQATLLWIAYFFNYIQIENPTRKNLFCHLKGVLFKSVRSNAQQSKESGERSEDSNDKLLENKEKEEEGKGVKWKPKENWDLPLPPNIYDELKDQYDEAKTATSDEEEKEESTENQSLEEEKDWASLSSQKNDKTNNGETNVNDMKVILDILYRIFGRLWVYTEIQTVFHAMPPTQQVDLPFTLRTPKPLLKTDSTLTLDKLGKKLSMSEKSLEEEEPEKQLHKNDFILPLQAAEESKLILRQLLPRSSSQRSNLGRKKT